jgi:hypothetical protein
VLQLAARDNWVVEMLCEDGDILRRVFDCCKEAVLFWGFLKKKGRRSNIWRL